MIQPNTADLSVSIPQILEDNPSAIIMADVGRLPPEISQPLQRWIARGGTLEPMLVAQCKAELTRQRTRQLQSIEEWPE